MTFPIFRVLLTVVVLIGIYLASTNVLSLLNYPDDFVVIAAILAGVATPYLAFVALRAIWVPFFSSLIKKDLQS